MNLVRRGLTLLTVALLAGALGAAETPNPFKDLKFRLAGPAVGGRASRAVGVPGNPLLFYAATAGGGVWKSSDGGTSFQPVFDDQPTSSTGASVRSPHSPSSQVWRPRSSRH